jgi:tetratricopeptide (TPR) repeat protein
MEDTVMFLIDQVGFKRVLLASALLCFLGCGTPRYSIKSDPPGSTVVINEKKIGQTPLDVSIKELPDAENINIEVSKEKYGKFEGIIPGPRIATLGQDVFIKVPKLETDSEIINKRIAELLHAHQLALRSHFSEAIEAANRIISEDPNLVAAQLLKGSILFLSKNYTDARTQYNHVLEMDAANQEANQMLEFMRNLK